MRAEKIKKIKDLLENAIKKARFGLEREGIDTTTPEYQTRIENLKVSILKKAGVTIEEYELAERFFDTELDLLRTKIRLGKLETKKTKWGEVEEKPEIKAFDQLQIKDLEFSQLKHRDEDHATIVGSITDLKEEDRALAEKIQQAKEDLQKQMTTPKIRHGELLAIGKDDHHPEEHNLESHVDSDWKDKFKRLIGGQRVDDLHTHAFPLDKPWVGEPWGVTKGDTDVWYLKIDGTNSPSANINWGGYRITNLANPIADQDAATKAYCDDAHWLMPPIIEWYDPTGGLPGDGHDPLEDPPEVGDRYGSDGDGSGWYDGYIYEWDGEEWVESEPEEGWMIWDLLEMILWFFFSGGWEEVGYDSYWSMWDDQTGLTGDKTGSFDLTTTGTITGINVTSGADPGHTHTAYQPIDADLSAIAALGFVSTSFLKKTAANTWALDTTTYEPTLTKGNLTTTTTGLAITGGTGAVIGSGATINADTGYGIPTTAKMSNWDAAYGWGQGLKLDQTTPQSVINGRPTFVQGLLLGTSPTIGTFAEGKLYYNATKKTINVEIDTDITLAIGEQELVYCYNSGSEIPKGSLVYPTGGSGNTPTIALAMADAEATSLIIGVTIQTIPASGSGFVLVRGVIDGVDTSSFDIGDTLYLSPSVAGAFTKTAPTTSEYLVRVGVCLLKDATTGSIYIRPIIKNRLSDLGDVAIVTPATDQVIRYNGVEWVNGAGVAASASKGVGFYYDGTEIIATGANNDNHVETLSKSPWSGAEDVEDTSVNNSTVLADIYLYDTALGRTTLEAGAWIFSCYCAVNLAAGVSEILHNVTRVRPGAGTVTITDGADSTHKVATASEGTPFASTMVDVGGTVDSDSYIRLPAGAYRITTRTDDTHIIFLVPSTYTKPIGGVAFSVHKRLFQVTTGEINNTASAPLYEGIQLYTINSVQPSYTILTTDKIAIYRFAKTTSTVTKHLYFAYGGTTRYSRVDSPLATLHGDLAGLQGGTGVVPTEQYYHLTLAQYTIATQPADTTNSGYLTTTDWDTFNEKVTTHNLLSAVHLDSTTGSALLGDLIYADANPKWTKLAGNTTTTKKFLRQTGTGAISAVPAWDTLVDGDIPSALTGKTYNGLTLTANADGFQIAGGTTSRIAKFIGADITFTGSGTNVYTFPGATSTLASLDQAETFTNKVSYNGLVVTANTGAITTGSWHATTIAEDHGGTGVANGAGHTITVAGPFSTVGHYTLEFTTSNNTAITLPTTGTLSTLAGTETFTNKRITQRVTTVADSATPTPAADDSDMFTVTALAQAATFGAPTGTPLNGQKLIIRVLDNGTARALAWNAIYRASTDIALPTTTTISKTMYLGFIYNSASTKWDFVAMTNGF
jgi:hypothetical protein